jgi:hemoglobin/transferrin/lactoferrin receptor protein
MPVFVQAQIIGTTGEKDTLYIKEVVIIASRFQERKEDVSQQVELVHANRLQQLNAASTADVLQQTPGILVQKSQLGGGSPMLRGFEASRVLLVVDGVRLNNAIYRAGHLQNAITMDNLALDRVEVGFGPGGVSYGSDALGGVIHFHTKDPQLNNTSLNALTRYSSAANESTISFNVNYGNRNKASFTNITWSSFGDLRQGAYQLKTDTWKTPFYVEHQTTDVVNTNDNPYVQKKSGYQQLDILQKVLFKGNEKLAHLLNFQFSTSTDVPRYDRLAQLQSNGTPQYAEWYYGPQKRLLGSYQLQFKGLQGLFNQSNITAAYQFIEESRHDRRLNNSSKNNRTEMLNIFSLNADFNKTLKKHELSYGLELVNNDVNSSAHALNINTAIKTSLSTRYPDGGSQLFSAGIFFSHRWEINKKWLLADGLRLSYSDLNSKFRDQTFFPFPFNTVTQNNTALNGNVSLLYKPDNNWHLSILGSTGFRVPNVDDLSKVFESVPGSIIVPNPDLKPEQVKAGELTAERRFQNGLLRVSLFHEDKYDALISQTFATDTAIPYDSGICTRTGGCSFIQNVEHIRTRGLEMSTQWQDAFVHGLDLQGSATFTDAEVMANDGAPSTIGNKPTRIPKNMFKAVATYHQGKHLTYSLAARYSGRQYTNLSNSDINPDTFGGASNFFIMDAKANYQFADRYTVSVGMDNINNCKSFVSHPYPHRTTYLQVKFDY